MKNQEFVEQIKWFKSLPKEHQFSFKILYALALIYHNAY